MNIKLFYNSFYIELSDRVLNTLNASEMTEFTVEQGNKQIIKEIVNSFFSKKESKNFRIVCGDFEWLYNQVKKQFVYIEAAGGFIEKNKEYLFIYRNNLWDLPKGKLEKNEKTDEAAIRECEEECGIKNLSIQRQLNPSYHIYSYKGNYALKKTYWYYMHSSYNKKLIPQLEENITEVKWCDLECIKNNVIPQTYITIKEVISDAIGLN